MPPQRQACANPLYLQCITQLLREAEAQGRNAAFAYRNAHNAILQHPDVFESPADALRLKGIGHTIVAKIQRWLDDRNRRNIETVRSPETHPRKRRRIYKQKDAKVVEEVEGEEEEQHFPPITPVVFESDTFDIVLVLDAREIKNKQDRTYISAQLQTHGIRVEVRTLELGDVIWVARRREDGAELVLDYIVERKRMDDLVDSIKKARFTEQKTRLARSGAAHVVYIIEKFDAPSVDAFNPKAIATAISTTQIVDGFFVKRTASIDHTIAYLAKLHAALTDIYSTQRLHGIPDEHIDRTTFLALKRHLATPHFVSYQSFRTLNSKAGSMTLCDNFAIVLAIVRGVSGAKAIKIAKKYRTPQGLLAAYTALDNVEDRKRMVHDDMNSDVTIATSVKLWETWFAK